jgi:hypothetical protein
MTHEEMQSTVNHTDKLIVIKKQISDSAFMIESVLMLQGSNLTHAAYATLSEVHLRLTNLIR